MERKETPHLKKNLTNFSPELKKIFLFSFLNFFRKIYYNKFIVKFFFFLSFIIFSFCLVGWLVLLEVGLPLFSPFASKCYRNIRSNVFFHSIFNDEKVLKVNVPKEVKKQVFLFLCSSCSFTFPMWQNSKNSKFLFFPPKSTFDSFLKAVFLIFLLLLILLPVILILALTKSFFFFFFFNDQSS